MVGTEDRHGMAWHGIAFLRDIGKGPLSRSSKILRFERFHNPYPLKWALGIQRSFSSQKARKDNPKHCHGEPLKGNTRRNCLDLGGV